MAKSQKKVLVTGGAGFIGRRLVKRLLQEGYSVTVIDSLVTGKRVTLPPSVKFFKRCVCTLPVEIRHEHFDEVYHLASPASPHKYRRLPEETYHANVLGTDALCQLAHESGAKLLYASTSEVYGEPYQHPQSENSWGKVETHGPRAIYEQSKRMGESICYMWASRGTKITIARIFNTYGPDMSLDDGRVIVNFICQERDGKPFTIYGDGKQTRSFCYIDDTIEALLTLMESGAAEPYNVGNPEETSILELAKMIDPGRLVKFLPLPEYDPTRRCPDITKIKQLGWSPEVRLGEGIKNMRKAYSRVKDMKKIKHRVQTV